MRQTSQHKQVMNTTPGGFSFINTASAAHTHTHTHTWNKTHLVEKPLRVTHMSGRDLLYYGTRRDSVCVVRVISSPTTRARSTYIVLHYTYYSQRSLSGWSCSILLSRLRLLLLLLQGRRAATIAGSAVTARCAVLHGYRQRCSIAVVHRGAGRGWWRCRRRTCSTGRWLLRRI